MVEERKAVMGSVASGIASIEDADGGVDAAVATTYRAKARFAGAVDGRPGTASRKGRARR